ncbi:MAG: TetR/AcrR family transcriptional regulator [Proteobacteria bacterium]|nr:TetR/AcrR family transcriptional regulator [Pseudomonadota bacterium]
MPGRVAPTQHGRRATAASRRTREHVLATAAACIAEEGFAAAHTNRIAERAGVSWGVLQYHFGDKAGLLNALLERGFQELRAEFEHSEIAGETLRERIAAVVDAGFRIFTSPYTRAGNEILVNLRSQLPDDDRRSAELDLMWRELQRLGRRALGTALGAGVPTREVEAVLFSSLRGFSLALMMQPRDLRFAAERAALTEMIARHVEAGSRTKSTA